MARGNTGAGLKECSSCVCGYFKIWTFNARFSLDMLHGTLAAELMLRGCVAWHALRATVSVGC